MEKVSIVVPVYNTANYLDRCVQSLVCQSYPNIEIVLVNDGSTDNSLDIIKHWQIRDSRVVYVDQSNQGVTCARKNGSFVATGTWVCFVDSDDEVPLDAIEKMIAFSENVEIVIGYVDAVGWDSWRFSKFDAIYSRTEYLKDLLWKERIHWGPFAKLFRKELLDDFSFDIPRKITNGEDFLFNLRVAGKMSNVRIIDSVVYHYRLRNDSATFNDPFLSISYCLNFEKEFWRAVSNLKGYFRFLCLLRSIKSLYRHTKHIFLAKTLWKVLDKRKIKHVLSKFGFRKK